MPWRLLVLLALLLLFAEGTRAITCSCNYCGSETCEANICNAQAIREDGVVRISMGCFNDEYDYLCGTSSSGLIKTLCCTEGDRCNEFLDPQLGTVGTDVAATPEPTTAEPTEGTTLTQPATAKYCRKGSTERPAYSLCPLETTCFTTVRKRSDGTVTYRQGCSKPNQPCVSEQRSRKIKHCCNSSLCNNWLPVLDGDIQPILNPNEDYSTLPTPDSVDGRVVTLPPENVSSPTDAPTSEDPPTSNDILTLPPPSVAPQIACYCDACADRGMVCHSKVGCAAIFRTNEASQQLESYRTCLNTTSVCSYHESGLHVFCCYDSMCNEPSSDHVTSGLTTVPPNTVPITIPPTTKEPETTEDLPVDTASSSSDVYPSSTVLGVVPTTPSTSASSSSSPATPIPTQTPPTSPPDPVTRPDIKSPQSNSSSDNKSWWLVGTGIAAALCLVFTLALVVMCVVIGWQIRPKVKRAESPIMLNNAGSQRSSLDSKVSLSSEENSQTIPV